MDLSTASPRAGLLRRRAVVAAGLALPVFLLAESASPLGPVFNYAKVAIGLGLVIFFHELGHFAVAKWCGVMVERFSIGFGPVLLAKKLGETEYALSAVPFGGYVKMLGQDDADPSQLTSEEIAQDPRSYTAKSVPQRMAIISAGVIMNILTAVLFYAGAYGLGVRVAAPSVGYVKAGGPAWRAGMRPGDVITEMNGRSVDEFADILRGVALTAGNVNIVGRHDDGTTFDVVVTPEREGTRRKVGLGFGRGLVVGKVGETKADAAYPGTPAAAAEPGFNADDRIVSLDGEAVDNFAALQRLLDERRDRPVTYGVRRDNTGGRPVEITVEPRPVISTGLRVDVGPIRSIVKGSPADRAGFAVKDRILKFDGREIGSDLDPVDLPYEFDRRAGEPVEVEVLRPVTGGEPETLMLTVTPEDRIGGSELPRTPGEPLAIPAIGAALPLIPTVLHVVEEGPAAEAGIRPNDHIVAATFTPPEGEPVTVSLEADADAPEKPASDWAFVVSTVQQKPLDKLTLTVVRESERLDFEVASAVPADPWYLPTRGVGLLPETLDRKAADPGEAISLGVAKTQDSVTEMYLTLRGLVTNTISIFEVSGPVKIFQIAYSQAESGLSDLLVFLGFLSVNLAVLNFLPIPVLDGGHMVFLIWEGVTGKKPNEQVQATATYVGFAFILTLMVTVLYLDIFTSGPGG
ncbi:MAG: RIP metalloprotease RseP [Planctomycetota bacterium]